MEIEFMLPLFNSILEWMFTKQRKKSIYITINSIKLSKLLFIKRFQICTDITNFPLRKPSCFTIKFINMIKVKDYMSAPKSVMKVETSLRQEFCQLF